jgi:hypothetical protein
MPKNPPPPGRAKSAFPGFEYDFEVREATILDEDARKQWFPPWPPGTVVHNQVDGRC